MNQRVKRLTEEVRQLSAEEKALLVEELWDILSADAANVPTPDWHREELDHRLAEHLNDPEDVVPWDEALARLQARRR